MKRLGAVLLVAAGVGMVLLGLLFLMAAGGRAYRYAVAVGLLTFGGALAGFGVRLFKQAEAASPEQLRAEILALAKQRGGELLPRRMVARCETCKAAFPLNDQVTECPQCGGTLNTQLERALGDGAFRMEE